MRYKILAQIAIIVISIILIVLVIQPKLQDIQAVEDEAASYEQAIENVSLYNQKLDNLLQAKNQLLPTDLDKLDTFLPDTVDALEVMSDILQLADMADMTVTSLQPAGEPTQVQLSGQSNQDAEESESESDTGFTLTAHDFNVVMRGTYRDFKQFLTYVSVYKYPLELQSVSFSTPSARDDGTVQLVDPETVKFDYTLTLRTYNFTR